MVTAVFIGQTGNGGAAIKSGNHGSQKKGGGGGAAKSGGGPISASEIKTSKNAEGDAVYTFSVQNGNKDGTDAVISATSFQATVNGKTAYDFNFTVDGSFSRTKALKDEAGTLVSNNVAKAFRQEVSSRPSGTIFKTEAFSGDGRGNFREAMYAKQGFSFGNGDTSGGLAGFGQYGVVKGGRLVPADSRGKAFNATKQKEHASNVRQAIRDSIRDTRAGTGV